jgi:hypothetical protein
VESGAEGLYCFTEVLPVLAPRGCCAVLARFPAIGRGVSKQAARRTRVTLPIEGRIWLAQRFAVDYEQLGTLKPSAMSSDPNISS